MPNAERTTVTETLRLGSEALLQQAIAGLLVRLPNVEGVQILQGSQEFGKDIVFSMKGGFTEDLFCACVVKNTKVSGQADSSSGARTIVNQIQQAFDTDHYNGTGNELRIQRVYVVTPEPITPATINSIKGRLQERSGQIIFIGGSDLFDLFRKFWPDFVAEQAGAIERHLRSLKKAIESTNPLSNLATLYHLGDASKPIEQVYVEQGFVTTIGMIVAEGIGARFVPSPKSLSSGWKRSEIAAASSTLSTLLRYLNQAEEWGYLADSSRTTKSRCIRKVKDFLRELQQSFTESLRRKYSPQLDTVPNVGPDASVGFHNVDGLIERANDLINAVDRLLASIYSAAEDNLDTDLIDALIGSAKYASSAKLFEFAHVCPDLFDSISERLVLSVDPSILDRPSTPLLITGAAGFGKTSFCKWMSLRDAEKYRTTEGSSMVPMYVPLHQVATLKLESFDDLLLDQFTHSGLVGDLTEMKGSSIRLYLDGLDEVPDVAQRKKIVDIARVAFETNRVASVIVTARTYIHAPWLTWLSRLTLAGFDTLQLDELAARWLTRGSQEHQEFFAQLDASASLRPLMRTPLLATLIILVFRQTGRLPENEVRLYDIFIDLLTEGWNLAKRLLRHSKYGSQLKKMILRRIAAAAHLSRRRQFELKDLRKAVSACVKLDTADTEAIIAELLEDGLVVQSGAAYEFCHFSFQEYLTARLFQGDPAQRGVSKALRKYLLGDDWWFQVLRFYLGLSGNPGDIDRWLANEERRLEGKAVEIRPLSEMSEDEDENEEVDVAYRSRLLQSLLGELYPNVRRISST